VYEVFAYRTPQGTCPYQEFQLSLRRSGDRQALRNLEKATQRLGDYGLTLLNSAMMDNIEDDIYELRVGPYRVFCFYDRQSGAFVLLNGFRKQTQRTPESQKARAIALVNQYLDSRRR
jgi:phage-related protein